MEENTVGASRRAALKVEVGNHLGRGADAEVSMWLCTYDDVVRSHRRYMSLAQLEEVMGAVHRIPPGGRKARSTAKSAALQGWCNSNPEPESERAQLGLQPSQGTSGAPGPRHRAGGPGNDGGGQPHTGGWADARRTKPVRRSSQQGSGLERAGQGLYDPSGGSVPVGSTADARRSPPVRRGQTPAGSNGLERAGQNLYDPACDSVSVGSTADARRPVPVRSGQALVGGKADARRLKPVRSRLALGTREGPIAQRLHNSDTCDSMEAAQSGQDQAGPQRSTGGVKSRKRTLTPLQLQGDTPITIEANCQERDASPPEFTVVLEGAVGTAGGPSQLKLQL
jgi:hypothetical protein